MKKPDPEYKDFANLMLKQAIQTLQAATTPQSLRYRILIARINADICIKHGYWWQYHRIQNWINFYARKMSTNSGKPRARAARSPWA